MEGKFDLTPIHIVRGLQGLIAIITLGLLAHVAQFFNSTSVFDSPIQVPNEVAFAVFVPVFTLLITLPYVLLTPRYFPHLFKHYTKYSILAIESLTMLFYFASFVSVASFIGKLTVCRGDVCHAAKAGAAISAISWITWGVTSLFALKFCLGAGSAGSKEGSGNGGIQRAREKIVKGLRLQSVWPGHEQGEKQRDMEEGHTAVNGWPRNEYEHRNQF